MRRSWSIAPALRPAMFIAFLSLLAACDTRFQRTERREQKQAEAEPDLPPGPPPPAELWKEFSGENALAHVKRLVDFGPRPSGSNALAETRAYLIATLRASGWEVEQQAFTGQTPRGPVAFVNLIARFGGSAKTQQAIVCSHYDTKIFDTIRFVGANDGGSSTGALLELARVLALDRARARRVELVFFDGEEAVAQFNATDGLYGSRYYARELRDLQRASQFRFGILWDMIGDADLTITLPPDSPPQLARGVLDAATTLGLRDHFSYHDRDILDDHFPLNAVGIPTIDLIDFKYPPWHTADDTVDKLSAESLRKIGGLTLFYLTKQL